MATKEAQKREVVKARGMTLQEKFVLTRKEMNNKLIERSGEIDLCLTALICQKHALLVGPPGTAKSLVAETIRTWLDDGTSLTIHCCKDTTRNVAFGPVKVSALKEDRTERNLLGGAADVHILILEEVFKAGPAVLDMFLMLMNERVYREGIVKADAPLMFLMGASNEWSPDGCEAALSAFFDRFLFRKSVSKIRSKSNLERLLWERDHTPKLSTTITPQEIHDARAEAQAFVWEDGAQEAFMELLRELKQQGIDPGDRRLYQSIDAVNAFAYLSGADYVTPEHFEILAHVLWDDPTEQPKKCAEIVSKIANPIGMAINNIINQAEDVIEKNTPSEAVPKLQDLQRQLKQMKDHPEKSNAHAYLASEIKRIYNQIIGINED